MAGTGNALASRLTRRGLVGRAALAGAAGLAEARPPVAGAMRRVAAPAARQGLSGEITVSFSDETGIRQPFVARAAEAVQAANPGATVAVDAQDVPASEYQIRFFLAMGTGNVPDVFHLTGTALGLLAASGAIRPLDDFLAAWPDWAFYPQPVKDALTYEGQVWGIPYALDTHYLFYRKDVFAQAGLPADWQPANIDGILEAALAVNGQGSSVIPYALYAGENAGTASVIRGFLPLLYAYGGTMTDEQGKWIIDSPAVRNTFRYYARAFLGDELVPQTLLTTPNPTTAVRELLGGGRLAMAFDGSWVYGPWRDADPAGTAETIGYLLHPTEGGGPSFTVGGAGDAWFISAACQHPELAWELVKTINAAETVAAICLADPHPAARTDAVEQPAYQADPFLVAATASIEFARIAPPSPHYIDLLPIVQRATGLVATGETAPEDAAARYAEDLIDVLGADNVVTQV